VSTEGWDPMFKDGGRNEEERDDSEEDRDDEDGNGDRDDNAAEDSDGKAEKDDLEVNEAIRKFKISSNAARACLALSPDQSTVATSPSLFLAPLNRTLRFRRASSCSFWRARMHGGMADHAGGGSSERRRRGLSLGRVDS